MAEKPVITPQMWQDIVAICAFWGGLAVLVLTARRARAVS